MKKILLLIILFQSIIYANNTDLILNEIKGTSIKQLRLDMNERFEQVDKRFEQINKRFDTIFIILYILMGLVFVSPFMAIYLRGKKEIKDKKNFDILKDISLKNLQKIIKKQ